MAELFKLSSVTKRYNGRVALDAPDLKIEERGCRCITGRNGSGKTTLLQILAGLLPASSGTVAFARRSLPAPPGAAELLASELTLLHQSPYLFRGTVADNVEYGLRCRHVPHKQRRAVVESILGETGLLELAGRNVRELSGGESQRVAVARALALDTPVILLDEPFSNIDPGHRAALMDLLRRKVAAGKTVILSALHQSDVGSLADEVIEIADGRVRAK